MADIVSKIKMLFESKGAKQAAGDISKVGAAQTDLTKKQGLSARATTRQANASANVSRQFSAQASGLGGLVSAYAGAAANIFAITMAFNALERAARVEATIQGVQTLAASVGENGDKVIAKIQQITQGQVSMGEAASAAALALSAGMDLTQIAGLTEAATKASKALGRDLTDAMNRVFKGAAKVEPELLDELGIIVRVDDAVQKYAESLNKTASSLTAFERAQAFTNAIIDQSTSKYADIDVASQTSIKSFEQLSASVADIATQLGGLLAGALGPVVEFLTGNFLNTLSLVGLLGVTVFSKLGSVSKDALGKVATSAENAGKSVTNFLGKKGAAKGALELQKKLEDVKFAGKGSALGLKSMSREARNNTISLLKLAQSGKITAQQIRELNIALKGNVLEGSKLVATANASAAAVSKLGLAARMASTAFMGATKAVKGFSKALQRALGWIGIILTVVSLLQMIISSVSNMIFGFDLLSKAGESISSFFSNWRKEMENTKKAAETTKEILDLTDLYEKKKPHPRRPPVTTLKEEAKDVLPFVVAAVEEGGLTSKTIATVFADGFRNGLEENSQALLRFSDEAKKSMEKLGKETGLEGLAAVAELKISLEDVNKQTPETIGNLAQLVTAVDEYQEMLNAGSISIDTFDKETNTQMKLIKRLRKEIDDTSDSGKDLLNFVNNLAKNLENANLKIGATTSVFGQLKKSIDITPLPTFTKFVDGMGKIATTARELKESELRKVGMLLGQLGDPAGDSAEDKKHRAALEQQIAVQYPMLVKEIDKMEKKIVSVTRQYEKQNKLLDIQGQTLRAQNELKRIEQERREEEARFKMAEALQKSARRLQKEMLSLKKAELAVTKAISDANVKELEHNQKLLKIDYKREEIDIKRSNRALRDANTLAEKLAGVTPDLFTTEEKQQFKVEDLKIGVKEAQELLVARKAFEQKFIDNQTKINNEKKKLIALQYSNERQLLILQKEMSGERKSNLEKELELAKKETGDDGRIAKEFEQRKKIAENTQSAAQINAEAAKENRETALTEMASNAQFILDMSYTLEGHPKALAGVLNLHAKHIAKTMGVKDSFEIWQGPKAEGAIKSLRERAEGNLKNIEELRKTSTATYDKQIQQAKDIFNFTVKQLTAEKKLRIDQAENNIEILKNEIKIEEEKGKILDEKIKLSKEISTAEVVALTTELELKKKASDDNIKSAEDALVAAQNALATQKKLNSVINDKFTNIVNDIARKLSDRVGNALRDLNTAIMEGTLTMENFKQGFKDFLVGVITDIQSTIFEEIVVKPIQDWVRKGVRTLAKNLAKKLGITLPDTVEETAEKIATNIESIKGALDNVLKVKVTNAAEICACMGDSGQLMVDDRPATGGFNTRRDGGLGQLMVGGRPDTGGFNTRRDGGPGSGGRIRDLGGALQLDPISVTAAPLFTQNTRDFYTELGSVKSTISEMPTVLSDLNVALQESGINLGQVGATAALTFGGILAATGDFGTALLSTFIQIFTQIIAQSFASSFSFAASGGLIGKHMDVMGVQRLQSGGSVAYRDRVPALLEPGEFVIRKPIARQIGGPALERMNATGAGGGGMPEISVNVKNEGTPKQGDASVQPSLDPKEFVVDIVLKDLRNNGPIKQSMRSGTGRR